MLPDKTIDWVYIDGTDAATEGTFVSSVTGAAMEYMNWIVGEPNNCCDGEHCLNMYSYQNGLWNDIGCEVELASVCEIERRKCFIIMDTQMMDIVFEPMGERRNFSRGEGEQNCQPPLPPPCGHP